jgi:hypothetical protein
LLAISHFNGAIVPEGEYLQPFYRALAVGDELLAQTPDDLELLVAVSEACQLLGTETQFSEPSKSKELFLRGLAIGTRLTKLHPERLDIRENVARSRWFFGKALANSGDEISAREQLIEASTELSDLLVKAPRASAIRKSNAEVCITLAYLCAITADAKRGLQFARSAQECAQQLRAESPGNANYRILCLDSGDAAARCLEADGQLDLAVAERLNLNEIAQGQTLSNRESQVIIANWEALASLELERRNHEVAANVVDEFVKLTPDSHAVRYRDFVRLARCAHLALTDGKLAMPQRREASQRYLARGREIVQLGKLAAEYSKANADTQLLLVLANAQAALKLSDDHEAVCRRALEFARNSGDARVAERTSKACSLMPLADAFLRKAALELAQSAAVEADHPERQWRQLALGMAEFRQGHFEAANAALAEVDIPDLVVTAACFRAMSLYKLGNRAEARQVLATTARDMGPYHTPYLHDVLMGLTSFREASDIIGWDDTTLSGDNAAARP